MNVHGSRHTRDRQHATYLRDLGAAAGARLVVYYLGWVLFARLFGSFFFVVFVAGLDRDQS